jgi:hypothetical protein
VGSSDGGVVDIIAEEVTESNVSTARSGGLVRRPGADTSGQSEGARDGSVNGSGRRSHVYRRDDKRLEKQSVRASFSDGGGFESGERENVEMVEPPADLAGPSSDREPAPTIWTKVGTSENGSPERGPVEGEVASKSQDEEREESSTGPGERDERPEHKALSERSQEIAEGELENVSQPAETQGLLEAEDQGAVGESVSTAEDEEPSRALDTTPAGGGIADVSGVPEKSDEVGPVQPEEGIPESAREGGGGGEEENEGVSAGEASSADAPVGSTKSDASEGSTKSDASEGSTKSDASEGSTKSDAPSGSTNSDASEGSTKSDASEGGSDSQGPSNGNQEGPVSGQVATKKRGKKGKRPERGPSPWEGKLPHDLDPRFSDSGRYRQTRAKPAVSPLTATFGVENAADLLDSPKLQKIMSDEAWSNMSVSDDAPSAEDFQEVLMKVMGSVVSDDRLVSKGVCGEAELAAVRKMFRWRGGDMAGVSAEEAARYEKIPATLQAFYEAALPDVLSRIAAAEGSPEDKMKKMEEGVMSTVMEAIGATMALVAEDVNPQGGGSGVSAAEGSSPEAQPKSSGEGGASAEETPTESVNADGLEGGLNSDGVAGEAGGPVSRQVAARAIKAGLVGRGLEGRLPRDLNGGNRAARRKHARSRKGAEISEAEISRFGFMGRAKKPVEYKVVDVAFEGSFSVDSAREVGDGSVEEGPEVKDGSADVAPEGADISADVTPKGEDVSADVTPKGTDVSADVTPKGEDGSAEVALEGADGSDGSADVALVVEDGSVKVGPEVKDGSADVEPKVEDGSAEAIAKVADGSTELVPEAEPQLLVEGGEEGSGDASAKETLTESVNVDDLEGGLTLDGNAGGAGGPVSRQVRRAKGARKGRRAQRADVVPEGEKNSADVMLERKENSAHVVPEGEDGSADVAPEKVENGSADVIAKLEAGPTEVAPEVRDGAANVKSKVEDVPAEAMAKVENGSSNIESKVGDGFAEVASKTAEGAEKKPRRRRVVRAGGGVPMRPRRKGRLKKEE